MASVKPLVGIDLGGTNMQIGVVSREHKLLAQTKCKTKADEGLDGVVARLADGIDEACRSAGLTRRGLSGVGIGAPGAVDPREGVVLEAVNLRWDDVPLASILSKTLDLPVFLDNDVNAAVYGENRLGAGKNARNMLGVWVGTGIGGGLILNGELYYGDYLTAGEIGHTVLLPNNPPGGRSLEHNCSRSAIVDRLARLVRANRKSILPRLVEGDLAKIKSRTLAEAYKKGDELTIEVLDDAADMLGVAVSNVVTLLSLERVVLGGGLTEAMGQAFVERVRRSAVRFAFPDRCKKAAIVAGDLGDRAGILGAAIIAMERMG